MPQRNLPESESKTKKAAMSKHPNPNPPRKRGTPSITTRQRKRGTSAITTRTRKRGTTPTVALSLANAFGLGSVLLPASITDEADIKSVEKDVLKLLREVAG